MRRPLRAKTCLAAALFGLWGCGGEPDAPRAPQEDRPAAAGRRQTILVLLDAARPDRFSCYGYPQPTTPEIDALAAEGVVFHRHYAQGTGTRESLPSLLYSRYFTPPIFPNDPQVPYSDPEHLFQRPDEQQISLARAFEEAGFATAAISAHLWIGEETPFAGEFQELQDLSPLYGSTRYPYPRADKVVDHAIEWIAEHREEDYFLYVHLMDTHYPHYFEDDAQELFGAATFDARRFREGGGPVVPHARLTADERRYVDALYDGSLRHADREIGRLTAFLRSGGLLESTTIALTSDHGEYLLEDPERPVFSHGGPWLETVARIPLVIYSPGRLAPGAFHGFSEGVDVGPTLLGLAEVPLPAGKALDGVDLRPMIAGTIAAKEQALTRGGLRTGTHKILFGNVRRVLAREPPEPSRLAGRLYDLEADPGESDNLFRRRPERVAELVDRYRQLMLSAYRRAQAARTRETPRAAFAISVRHARTDRDLPAIRGNRVPAGWSRLRGEPHSALVARDTDRELGVRLRIPDGRYRLSLGMLGRTSVKIGDRRRELVSRQGAVEFGDVEVSGETFRATLVPTPDGPPLRVLFFGFVPAGTAGDAEEEAERRRRLRALGYVQ